MLSFIRTIITTAFIMAFLTPPLWAMSADEAEVYLKKAQIEEQQGRYDEALKIYMEISKSGSGWALSYLSQLYAEVYKDNRKAAMWCKASLELRYPYDFICENRYDGIFSESELLDITRLAIQCIATNYTACEKYAPNKYKKELDLYYSKYCTVNDPTGSKLNIRREPNGSISSSFPNGWNIIIYEIQKDKNNKEWALAGSTETGQEIGWVFKNYLKCNTRPRL